MWTSTFLNVFCFQVNFYVNLSFFEWNIAILIVETEIVKEKLKCDQP